MANSPEEVYFLIKDSGYKGTNKRKQIAGFMTRQVLCTYMNTEYYNDIFFISEQKLASSLSSN